MKLIKSIVCFIFVVGIFCATCYAMEGEATYTTERTKLDLSAINKKFKMPKKKLFPEIIIRGGKSIQIMTDPKLIKRLREEIRELVYYDDPAYCSIVSSVVGDYSAVNTTHHFFINQKPTPQNIERAKIIIKNALLRLGYTRVVWFRVP